MVMLSERAVNVWRGGLSAFGFGLDCGEGCLHGLDRGGDQAARKGRAVRGRDHVAAAFEDADLVGDRARLAA